MNYCAKSRSERGRRRRERKELSDHQQHNISHMIMICLTLARDAFSCRLAVYWVEAGLELPRHAAAKTYLGHQDGEAVLIAKMSPSTWKRIQPQTRKNERERQTKLSPAHDDVTASLAPSSVGFLFCGWQFFFFRPTTTTTTSQKWGVDDVFVPIIWLRFVSTQ